MNDLQKHSEMGIASVFVGSAMIFVQLGVLGLVFLGHKDNQGIIYAFSIPFFMYCIGVPLGLLFAMIGFSQPNRRRTFARFGVRLTLAGPVVWILFLGVQTIWRPW